MNPFVPPALEPSHCLREENTGACERLVLEKGNVAGGCYVTTSRLLSWRVNHYHEAVTAPGEMMRLFHVRESLEGEQLMG